MDWREVVVVVLLSVTTILTAWVGFQASKWGGSMSISFSQASSARIEASRLEGVANRKLDIQASLFAQWVEATGSQQVPVADFLRARFPEPLGTAFDAWIELEPLKNPDAPLSPFDMPEYAIPELAEAADADRRADAKFEQALADNQRGETTTPCSRWRSRRSCSSRRSPSGCGPRGGASSCSVSGSSSSSPRQLSC